MLLDTYISKDACNSYIVYNDKKEAIIIDPGSEDINLIRHIEKIGVEIKYIFITHGHFDHIGGIKNILKRFPKAITYIHSLDYTCLSSPSDNLSILNGNKKISLDVKNVQLFEGEEELNLLGYKIKIIHTPFHSKGSSCFYFGFDTALFSGDTLFFRTIGRSDLKGSEERKINSSLSKLIKLPKETKIYPGHGIKTILAKELEYNQYLKQLI